MGLTYVLKAKIIIHLGHKTKHNSMLRKYLHPSEDFTWEFLL